MRALGALLLIAGGAVLIGCPPLGDDYEIVDSVDAAVGGAGGSGAQGGAAGVGGNGGTSSDAGPCQPTSCAGTCCGAVCIDLASDPGHCGGCDRPCPVGRTCNFGSCGPPGWVAMGKLAGEPSAREMAAHVWTGDRVFIWGGADSSGTALDDGALYDPLTGAWTPIAVTSNTPSPRVLATAVAVGSKVVVWGGGDAESSVDYKDGGIYDTLSQAWTKLPEAPSEARAAIGAAAGDEVLFWGGFDKSGTPRSGTFLLTVSTATWSTPSNGTAPPALLHPAWAVSSTDIHLYGGRPNGAGDSDLAWRAALATGSWSALPKGPSARFGSFGASDGTGFFAWSGTDGATIKNDGKLLIGGMWAGIGNQGTPPSGRWAAHRRSGWAVAIGDQRFLILGGVDLPATSFHKNGGLYDHTTASWLAVPAWGSGESHEWGVGVWTGVEFVLWGGRNGASLTATGERYLPPAP